MPRGFIQTVKPGEKPIIEPSRFSSEVKELNVKTAVMVFTSRGFNAVKNALGSCEEPKRLPIACFKAALSNGVGVFHSHFGSAASAMLLEALIAGGVKVFLVMGEAGSISGHVHAGDVVLPTWGLREEGVSYHYLEPDVEVKPDQAVLKVLEDSLAEAGLAYKLGGVWSTDAPFMETLSKVREFSKMGVLAVDMETTALMAVAIRRGARLAGVLVVTDELYTGSWKPMFDSSDVVKAVGRVGRAVADAAWRISQSGR